MPAAVEKFKAAVLNGTVNPAKLNQMTSAERRDLFKKLIGDEDSAKSINALFESRTLLKNQQYAYTAWAKKVAGITPQVRRDLLSRIEKMDAVLSPAEERAFL